MPLSIPGVGSDIKVPGVFIALDYGASPSGAAAAGRRGLIYANKITTDITAASPTFTVTAGTLANATPTEVSDAETAATLFGRGSEAHRMVKRFLEQAPGRSVTVVLVPEAATTRASAVLTFATNASAAFTLRLFLMGEQVDVSVASGDTPTNIATAAATAILAKPDLPVTAQFAAGVLTITAKHPGLRGNDLNMQAFFISATGVATGITTGATSSGAGTTGTLSGVAAAGLGSYVYTLTGGGAVEDVMTTALDAVKTTRYDLQASAHRTATQLDAIRVQLQSMGAPTVGIYQQALTALTATLGTATTLSSVRNAEVVQVCTAPVAQSPAEEIAAQVLAGRLYGDSSASGAVDGENSDPACNLIGLRLATVKGPANVADQLTYANQQSALTSGATPLVMSGVGQGLMVVRSITTRCLKNGLPFYGTFDTKEVTVPHFMAVDLKADLGTVFAGFKLGKDHSDGTPPRQTKVTTVNGIRDRIAFKLREYEERAILRRVEERMGSLLVEEDATTPGRVNAFIPSEPIPDVATIAAKLSQLQGSV